jgi:hypothetical protein
MVTRSQSTADIDTDLGAAEAARGRERLRDTLKPAVAGIGSFLVNTKSAKDF